MHSPSQQNVLSNAVRSTAVGADIANKGSDALSTTLPNAERIASWRAGRIVTRDGYIHQVARRWSPYKASRSRVWWEKFLRPSRTVQCQIFYHQHWSNPAFIVLGYVSSHPRASLASLYCGLLALDEIARLKRCDAIVADVNNDRISDRLLARWGWQQHCQHLRGRHFIKRFYGSHPDVPAAWRPRLREKNVACSS